jgi:hypothetical protein
MIDANVLKSLIMSELNKDKVATPVSASIDANGAVSIVTEQKPNLDLEAFAIAVATAVVKHIKDMAVVNVNVTIPSGAINTVGSPSAQANAVPALGTGVGTIS